jgi:hypothetical protein
MEPTEAKRPIEGTTLIAPTYAENVLHYAGFHFHPRNVGERLNLKRISTADIDAILRDVDTNLLSSFIEDITFCEITKADLRIHSQDTLVKLYQANQLIIEYLVDARETLSTNLNSLNEMHIFQKREIESLTTEVAKLKDELYWSSMVHTSPSRVDPSRYPTQEPSTVSAKKTTSFFEDSTFSLLLDRSTKKKTAATPSSIKSVCVVSKDHDENLTSTNGAICLNIVSSSNAILLQMNVEESTTVQKLKNKILSRLLIDSDLDFATHSLYHRDLELDDHSRNLDHYQISDNAALVFMPRPVRTACIASDHRIESKLDKLTTIASKSYEEIKRTLQLQLSGEFSQVICKQIKVLEESLRDELRNRVQNAVTIQDDKHDDAHEHAANSATMSSPVSNVHYLDRKFLQGDSLQMSDILPVNEDPTHADECRDMLDLPVTIDNTAEMEFNPPSQIEMHSPQERVNIDVIKEMNFTILCSHSQDGSLSTGSLDDIDKSFDLDAVNKLTDVAAAPSPNKGYLLYRGYNESKVPPEDSTPEFSSNKSAASLTSSETNHVGITKNDFTTDNAPNISFGVPAALDAVDDFTSVEIRSPSKRNQKSDGIIDSNSHDETPSNDLLIACKSPVMLDGKKGGFLKKLGLKNKPKKNPKHKNTMVEI